MKPLLSLVATALIAAAAGAQEIPGETYDFLMAKSAVQQGRYDEALSRFSRVLEKNPGNAVVMFERAMALIDAGRIDRAESELRRLTAAHPGFYDAQRILGRLLLERAGNDRTRTEEALRHLQAAFDANHDDLATGVIVSQILVAVGRTEDAEQVLATLVERSPDQRTLNYNYAQVLTKLGRGDESRPYLERAVQLDPTFTPAIFQLIDIYQTEGEWQKAADLLQPLVAEEPLNIELRRQQAFFLLRAGEAERARVAFESLIAGDPQDARSMFYLAEALNDLERYAEAEVIYRKLLEQSPSDPDLLASFGLTQLGLRRLDDAEATFRSLLSVEAVPDNLAALASTQLGYIELQRGRHEEAIAATRPVFVFRERPNNQAISIALEAMRKQKRFAEAADLLRPLTDQFPGDPFVNARYVEMLSRAGDPAAARVAAATQAKFGVRNLAAAAEAMVQAGQHSEAIAFLSKAIESKPDEIDLLFSLGAAHERAGDHQAAETVFLRLLAAKPEHAATLNYLGYMWADNNVNLDRAAEMLVRAVSQEPRNGAYVDSLGWVYYRQGKLDLAEKYLTDAARLLPRDAVVHEHLADVLAEQGKHEAALEIYRVALTLDPEPKDEEKIRSKIAEVERQAGR
ncbi:MAG TPA: tetratricopeptide repeat protein [Thermoanaerobaculia bacterium]|nr:tetratricopeptide repeat protein [Thermoanaerobaculia bacterium]